MEGDARDDAASAVDPVCQMTVDPRSAVSASVEGRTYYFCCDGCRAMFLADPEKYIAAPAVAPEYRGPRAEHAIHVAERPATRLGATYTCPMHPEIVRDAPGICPKCGMALEPTVATLDERENPELVDMQRRFWVSALFTVPVFLLGMGEMIPGDPIGALLPSGTRNIVECVLALPVVL